MALLPPYRGVLQQNRTRWTVILSCAFLASCDAIQLSPKLIEADGQTYVACRGLVWVNFEGGGLFSGGETFKVTFTDAPGLSHTLRGLKRVDVSGLPRMSGDPSQRPIQTSEQLSSEDERLLELYNSGSTAADRARATQGMTAAENKQLARAFIKKSRNTRTDARNPQDLCAAAMPR
jgi:hypothetical protein